mgnify:CR=1 FL=1
MMREDNGAHMDIEIEKLNNPNCPHCVVNFIYQQGGTTYNEGELFAPLANVLWKLRI